MGLSLNQVLVLLALILGQQACPGRSTLHRWIKAAGLAAGRVLKSLDARCRALVLVGCLDEIFFHGRPVLVGVEPASMAWFLGQKADDRTGATWAKALRDWTALSFVTADAGTGLQAGIAAVQQERREDGAAAVGERPGCVPHDPGGAPGLAPELEPRGTALGAGRGGQSPGRAGRSGRARMPGAWRSRRVVPGRRPRRPSRQYERSEAGWKIAHGALAVFRPDGRLNDRAWAEQQIALALPLLSGREWSKVRGFLQAEETLTFLDRLHRQLREAVPERSVACGVGAAVVAASAAAPSEHHGHGRGGGPCGAPGATGGLPEGGRELAGVVRAVSRVLRRTVRASSAVECMNSVLRMHQSRHRTVTQGLLDLKRLYWNCREFREGKRRRSLPVRAPGPEAAQLPVLGPALDADHQQAGTI